MKIEKYNSTMSLSGADIDMFSEKIDEAFSKINVESQNIMRVRLSLEELLLRFRDRFGEDRMVEVTIDSMWGKPFVQVDLEGEVYNPLNKTEVEIESWNDSLITAVGLSPEYSYQHGKNTIRFTLSGQRMNPALKIILFIVIGVLMGWIGSMMVPKLTTEILLEAFLDPVYSLWSQILLLLSGPVILLMVTTTILNTGTVSEQGADARGIVIRFFYLSIVVGLVSIIASIFVFEPTFQKDMVGVKDFISILETTGGFVPKNIFSPIITANTPQILAMAFILGGALVVVGRPAKELKRIVKQANMIGMQLTEWVSRAVPYVSGLLVALEILCKRTAILEGMAVPFIESLVISILWFGLMLMYVCISKHVGFRTVFNKILPPFKTAMIKGSLDASYGQAENSTVSKLGVEKNFAKVELPQGLVLYMPINVIGTIVFTIYAAKATNVDISLIWVAIAVVLSVILFVATPPVPGANLLAYIAIFNQLGIAGEVLIDAMIFDIVFGIFASAGNQTMLQLELVLQADKIGLLDRIKLIRP